MIPMAPIATKKLREIAKLAGRWYRLILRSPKCEVKLVQALLGKSLLRTDGQKAVIAREWADQIAMRPNSDKRKLMADRERCGFRGSKAAKPKEYEIDNQKIEKRLVKGSAISRYFRRPPCIGMTLADLLPVPFPVPPPPWPHPHPRTATSDLERHADHEPTPRVRANAASSPYAIPP